MSEGKTFDEWWAALNTKDLPNVQRYRVVCKMAYTEGQKRGLPSVPPEAGFAWVEVEGYEGVLKHCRARDAVKLEPKEHTGIFCLVGNKFYALKVPPAPKPQSGSGS